MARKLTIIRNWREGGPPTGGGGGMLYPGDYRVPEDVPAELAERIVAAGAGTIADVPDARGRGKKPALEDKAIARAPEDKSALGG